MVAPEGREYAPWLTLKAAESLVRSLVGVAGVSLKADANGVLREIVIVPEPGTSDRRLGRDVISALKARFGVSLHPEAITIAPPEAETDEQRAPRRDWPVSSIAPQGREAGALQRQANRNGSKALATAIAAGLAGSGNAVAAPRGLSEPGSPGSAASPDPATAGSHPEATDTRPAAQAGVPRLEQAEMEPIDRGLRCRITIALGDERFQGVAESAAGFIAEAELAARVTLDALRSARTPPEPLQLQGASVIDIAGRPHVVVSLSVWNGNEFEPLAGAEPIRDSIAEAAARAVLGSMIAHMGGETRPRA
jgi:hypothetical protein